MRVQSLPQEDPLEKEMATHSRILAWKIPWTGQPGGLQSLGLQRVKHHSDSLALVQGPEQKDHSLQEEAETCLA